MYYVVHDWMSTKLGIKGLERDVFAIIFGFSQNEKAGGFNGSLRYLSGATGYDELAICRELKKMVVKGLIIKNEIFHNGVKYCIYKSSKTESEILAMDDIIKVKKPRKKSQSEPVGNTDELATCKDSLQVEQFGNIEQLAVDEPMQEPQAPKPYKAPARLQKIINAFNNVHGTDRGVNTSNKKPLEAINNFMNSVGSEDYELFFKKSIEYFEAQERTGLQGNSGYALKIETVGRKCDNIWNTEISVSNNYSRKDEILDRDHPDYMPF